MPLNVDEVIHILKTLAEQENLRVTATESLKCGLMAGAGAASFAFLLGPIGAAIGGTLGSLFAASLAQGKFKSAAAIIAEDMTPHQQRELAASCRNIIDDLRAEDLALLLPLITNTPHIQQALIGKVVEYLTKDMKLQIID